MRNNDKYNQRIMTGEEFCYGVSFWFNHLEPVLASVLPLHVYSCCGARGAICLQLLIELVLYQVLI